MESETMRRADLILSFAESLCREAKFYAEDNWGNPEPWRNDTVTHKQIRQIQSRRCGPNFQTRLPEPLYKAVLYHVVNGTSSKKVKTKGEAADVLNTFAYCDEDVLRQWENFIDNRIIHNPVPHELRAMAP